MSSSFLLSSCKDSSCKEGRFQTMTCFVQYLWRDKKSISVFFLYQKIKNKELYNPCMYVLDEKIYKD